MSIKHIQIYYGVLLKTNEFHHITTRYWLVVSTILKHMSSSMGLGLSHIWNGKEQMFETTTQVTMESPSPGH